MAKAKIPPPFEVPRTDPPDNATSFNPEILAEQAKKMGMEEPSEALIEDLANLFSDGVILENEPILKRLVKARKKQLGFFRAIPYWFRKDEELARASVFNLAMAELLRQMSKQEVPGRSSPEKALSMLSMMESIVPQIAEGKSAKEMADRVNLALDAIDGMDFDEVELFSGLPHPAGISDPEGTDEVLAEDEQGFEKQPPIDGELSFALKEARIASRVIEDKNLAVLIRVARVLRELSGLDVIKSRQVVVDREGLDTRTRNITSENELSRISQKDWALRTQSRLLFLMKLATLSLQVRERVRTVTKKQLLYVLFDTTKSMRKGQRRFKAGGVLANRLAAVHRGDAMLFCRDFDSRPRFERPIETPEDAKVELRRVLNCQFSGEQTDIDSAIRSAIYSIREVMKNGQLERPEILVITDGASLQEQLNTVNRLRSERGLREVRGFPSSGILERNPDDDDLDIPPKAVTKAELGEIVLHAVVLEEENKDLVELAHATGGVVITNL